MTGSDVILGRIYCLTWRTYSMDWRSTCHRHISPQDRLWTEIEKDPRTGCWNYSGRSCNSYGALSVSGKQQYAHRVSYELTKGPIPEGCRLRRTCRNKRCVNPDHLRLTGPKKPAESKETRLLRKAERRFWSRVDKNGPLFKGDPCWLWTGSLVEGYGQFSIAKSCIKAHRYAYELLIWPIGNGLTLDHLCRNRQCVNPMHLEEVPPTVNTMRGNGIGALNARKTHCSKGHPLSGDNLYIRRCGRRTCKECKRKTTQSLRQKALDRANLAQRSDP
jgi:hypothetical protein